MRFMLLQDYFVEGVEPMSTWSPDDVKAHIDFQYRLNDELTERGELVEALALAESARTVINDGVAPVVTDGVFPETKEFLAGFWLVDVESAERAYRIAAGGLDGPGAGRHADAPEHRGAPGDERPLSGPGLKDPHRTGCPGPAA